jgi:superkiller protein 8
MSKQYLQTHTIPAAHPTDIFSLAVTPTQLISASGSSSVRIHSTTSGGAINPESATDENPFPEEQVLEKAHSLGCHHVCAAREGGVMASVGFEGDVKLWAAGEDGIWEAKRCIKGLLVVLFVNLRRVFFVRFGMTCNELGLTITSF